MAFMEDIKTFTYRAGVALATQFIFVTRAADGQVDPTGVGARADGVLLTTAANVDEAVTVAYDGRVMVKAAGTIARGAAVASNASGLAVAATTGNVILGYAVEAAVNNQIFTVELSRAGTLAP
jgi:Uncharacterized conserved protein (DUF2190)